MRKKRFEIKDRKEIDAILKRATIGRMATIGADGYPYITPVNYVYIDDSIYFHCAPEGEKIENLQRDSKVCFEVDIPLAYIGTDLDPAMEPCHVTQIYQSVILRGHGVVLRDDKEKLMALNALIASHEQMSSFNGITFESRAFNLCIVVRIDIDQISGKENRLQKRSEGKKQKIRDYLVDRDLESDRLAMQVLK